MVQRALENLMNDRTAFVIAHRLSTVRRANRIIVMENGRIAEAGSHEELLALNGIYVQSSVRRCGCGPAHGAVFRARGTASLRCTSFTASFIVSHF
jgi:ABC-type multidrug transport system ATPase subunit